MDNPAATLAAALAAHGATIEAATIDAALHDARLALADTRSQEVAHIEWTRRLRDGTLSERKTVGA